MNNHSKELECFGPEVNDTTLESMFRSVDAKGVFRGLKLYKTGVTFLDKQLFFEFASQHIDIDGNHNLTLNRIHRITFVRSKEVLRQFKYAGILYSNWVQKDPNDGAIFELVDGFQQLELFSVTDTKIPKIQRSAFGRCELINLRTINLARNEIHEVGDYAFYRVPNITCIILKENFIREISNSTFAFEKPTDQLLTIDLSTNLLRSESIQVDAFTRLNRPVLLNLHYNLLTYLDEQTFRPLLEDERSSLIVTSNKIACDCRMKWLLSDSHNYIDRVHGLVCGGHEQQGTELWYFTTYFLESVCNETMMQDQPIVLSSAWSAICRHDCKLVILICILHIFHTLCVLSKPVIK